MYLHSRALKYYIPEFMQVQLKDAVSALDFKVSNGGSNFSVGQRQLVLSFNTINTIDILITKLLLLLGLPSKSYFATKSYFNNGTQI